MRRARTLGVLLGAWPLFPAAPQITRDNYREYLPPLPPIVAAARGTVALRLFGNESDAAYRDVAPADGIDDARAAHLLRIAEHFSPILRPNNFSVPRDPADVFGDDAVLNVDIWLAGERVATHLVALGASPRAAADVAAPGGSADGGLERGAGDRSLRDLVLANAPRVSHPRIVPAAGSADSTLFFDVPGDGPPSWRERFGTRDPRRGSRVFVHPFVHDHARTAEHPAYQLVLQYWFFYPFNDAVNTHEGDWEHINVVVTTAAAARRSRGEPFARATLDSGALARLLAPSYPVEDSLIIAAVDYYFHDSVVTLDYLLLGEDRPPPARLDRLRRVWEDPEFLRRTVRRRLTFAGGRFATHPIVHVGGNNKGPDELLTLRPRFHGSFKRNSDGSFPLPGTWETVASFGVTEKLYGDVVPAVRADSTLPWYDLLDDPDFVHYRARDLTLIPDWERVDSLALVRDDVRRHWAWLFLPIYWGFPVSPSLGAGRLRHFDVGNVPPLSPPYHPTWNRIGVSARHRAYEVRALRTPVSPTSPWSALQSGWGALNLPFAAWGLMPGYNVALIQLMPWAAGTLHLLGAPPGRTFTPGALPRRITTASQGLFVESGGLDFVGALPRRDPVIDSAMGTRVEGRAHRARMVGPRLAFNLYFGERFSLENTYSWSSSAVRYELASGSSPAPPLSSVRGTLQMRQLTGGIRQSLVMTRRDAVHLYVRAGYGWLWYRASALRLDDRPLSRDAVRGGYLPPLLPSRHWWPNTWYAGAGTEVFAPRTRWLLGILGAGARLEVSESLNKVHFDEQSGRGDIVARRGDVALMLVFGW